MGRTQIIIAKHRNGAIGDIDMRFRADEVRFVDEKESLVNMAASVPVASAMNGDTSAGFSSQPAPSSSDFDGAPDFM